MTPLITKQQIGKFEKLSENIEDDEINPSILDAQQFDTIPVLPDNLLSAIEAIILAKPQQWNKNKTYNADDIVWYGDSKKWYSCKTVNTNSAPPSAYWNDCQLMNFYEQSLLGFLAYSAYYRFYAYHGDNVTQYGIRVMKEESSEQISESRRGAKLGDLRSKAAVYALKVSKALSAVSNTFDGVKYSSDTGECGKLKPKVQIYQLGGRHKKCNRRWDFQ